MLGDQEYEKTERDLTCSRCKELEETDDLLSVYWKVPWRIRRSIEQAIFLVSAALFMIPPHGYPKDLNVEMDNEQDNEKSYPVKRVRDMRKIERKNTICNGE